MPMTGISITSSTCSIAAYSGYRPACGDDLHDGLRVVYIRHVARVHEHPAAGEKTLRPLALQDGLIAEDLLAGLGDSTEGSVAVMAVIGILEEYAPPTSAIEVDAGPDVHVLTVLRVVPFLTRPRWRVTPHLGRQVGLGRVHPRIG